jgi:hypothetical protein
MYLRDVNYTGNWAYYYMKRNFVILTVLMGMVCKQVCDDLDT